MKPVIVRLSLVAVMACALIPGCKSPPVPPVETPPASGDIKPVRLTYADAEAFDVLLESALLSGSPVIVIQTEETKPSWGPRLNAWIAAWNMGSRVEGRKVRSQIPTLPQVVVDGDSIREFRLLIDDLMGRVEDSARAGTQWWAEKRMREHRVALLKPYNLRFHVDEDARIQLIFFHGGYADFHPDFIRRVAKPDGEESCEWHPGYCCSRCKQKE